MGDFKDLRAWTLSRHLTMAIYQLTREFPPSEQYGLTSQMRRAAVSIGANLAEGSGRRGDKEFARFIDIARGSAVELESLLILAGDLELTAADGISNLLGQVDELSRTLTGLRRVLGKR